VLVFGALNHYSIMILPLFEEKNALAFADKNKLEPLVP